MTEPNCDAYQSRTNFAKYTAQLLNDTSSEMSIIRLVNICRAEICGSLWGAGNPDISGIGMVVGYLLESIICVCIFLVHLWIICNWRPKAKIARFLLSKGVATFYDNAIFFTFAIQIASTVTLAQANFGIDADGMGAITMKIGWVVSTLTLLPLLVLILRPQIFTEGPKQDTMAIEVASLATGQTKELLEEAGKQRCMLRKARNDARQSQRFLLFVICWALSFYPFFSRMAGTFGKSQIGDSPGAAISVIDWGKIHSVCLANVTVVSENEYAVMTAFGITSWLFITIVIVYKIALSAMEDTFKDQLNRLRDWNLVFDGSSERRFGTWFFMCMVIFSLLVAEFWTLFRLRRFQNDMTRAAGGVFSDERWTFGQIVAAVVFFPVAVEVLFMSWKRSLF